MADRDCKNCKHYKLAYIGINYTAHSCERWDCKFEPKENTNENTEKIAYGRTER